MATMQVVATVSQLAAIRKFVAQTGRSLGLGEQAILNLQLAVDEICANVIEHGYAGQDGEIEITVKPVQDGVQVTIRDWGAAFDPQAIPMPDVSAPLEQRPLGGLGLFLVRQVMDKVHFEFDTEKGNLVTMVKRSQGQEGKR